MLRIRMKIKSALRVPIPNSWFRNQNKEKKITEIRKRLSLETSTGTGNLINV
jgi:hypothetical protein